MNILQDDKGNYSSLRVILLVLLILQTWLIILFSSAMISEIKSEDAINFNGLATLFTAMVGNTFSMFLAKIIQKKYERNN